MTRPSHPSVVAATRAAAMPAGPPRWMKVLMLAGGYVCAIAAASCDFNSGTRWFETTPKPPPDPECERGDVRCTQRVERCAIGADGVPHWQVLDDCVAQGKLCAPERLACVDCLPNKPFCQGLDVRLCNADGDDSTMVKTCDAANGRACRGGGCVDLCNLAKDERSNVGCEYWAVDLDNAMIDVTRNASAQQYAVVVSNPQPDVPVTVTITQDNSQPGQQPDRLEVAQAVIAPLTLRVFKLGPREVDGSPDGEFNTGTHSAWTRQAYRIRSDFPVVAYQFNPLENVSVFSNDASLLKSQEALTFNSGGVGLSYVVAGWPQTIAVTDDPNTNFSAANPTNLRAFLTIVGTRDNTHIVVTPTTRVLASDTIMAGAAGVAITMTIDAFDVVNLETPNTNAFGADFTGTTIDADEPIAVFVGSEASDAPRFDSLIERRCCADHLEEQLDPVRTAGRTFALAHSPSRTRTVTEAGGDIGIAPEPEFFRFVATTSGVTTVVTSLPPPDDEFQLLGIGRWRELSTVHDFVADSDAPIHVAQVMASQAAANVPRGLPGGDPSLLVVPPREQYRDSYVFLTPDKYAFDFVTIVAPAQAEVALDDNIVSPQWCSIRPSDGLDEEQRGGPPTLITYQCQLSFATVDPDAKTVTPGVQNDGVHRIVATDPVGVTVFGFDAFVSYAYAAGTELREIAPPQ